MDENKQISNYGIKTLSYGGYDKYQSLYMIIAMPLVYRIHAGFGQKIRIIASNDKYKLQRNTSHKDK